MTHPIFTIARQFGSGGREVGRKLADTLGIPFYDKELLTHAAEESGLSEEVLAYFDEKPTSSLLYSLSTGSYALNDAGLMHYSLPVNQQVFQAQFDAIRSLAERGPCVIVGRCADYVLQHYPQLVTVFVHAKLSDRVDRVAASEKLSPADAKTKIVRSDRKRANYYNFYSGNKWGAAANYDLCVSTSAVGIAGAAEIIARFAAQKFPAENG